jgi:hypothetical protein
MVEARLPSFFTKKTTSRVSQKAQVSPTGASLMVLGLWGVAARLSDLIRLPRISFCNIFDLMSCLQERSRQKSRSGLLANREVSECAGVLGRLESLLGCTLRTWFGSLNVVWIWV